MTLRKSHRFVTEQEKAYAEFKTNEVILLGDLCTLRRNTLIVGPLNISEITYDEYPQIVDSLERVGFLKEFENIETNDLFNICFYLHKIADKIIGNKLLKDCIILKNIEIRTSFDLDMINNYTFIQFDKSYKFLISNDPLIKSQSIRLLVDNQDIFLRKRSMQSYQQERPETRIKDTAVAWDERNSIGVEIDINDEIQSTQKDLKRI